MDLRPAIHADPGRVLRTKVFQEDDFVIVPRIGGLELYKPEKQASDPGTLFDHALPTDGGLMIGIPSRAVRKSMFVVIDSDEDDELIVQAPRNKPNPSAPSSTSSEKDLRKEDPEAHDLGLRL
ncbi:hypothetical protein FNYG_06093 [Fusarium nygamai]|uniref:Uncharacterized protein n=1 Tax=Gibberella nygamai TaxID=42673 RepID=A0A2K0WDZ7_GIBNY|nr:hypothetical protein FNYG_06093 [Fusarium nygamai]